MIRSSPRTKRDRTNLRSLETDRDQTVCGSLFTVRKTRPDHNAPATTRIPIIGLTENQLTSADKMDWLLYYKDIEQRIKLTGGKFKRRRVFICVGVFTICQKMNRSFKGTHFGEPGCSTLVSGTTTPLLTYFAIFLFIDSLIFS